MTGRERFDAIIEGRKPDRLPVYFTAVACTVASEILGRAAHTGADSLHFKEELALYHGEQAHREFEEKHLEDVAELWRALDVDIVREVWRSKMKPSKRVDENTLLFGDEDGEHLVKRFYPDTQSYGVLSSTYRQPDPEELGKRLEKELAETPELICSLGQVKSELAFPERLFAKMGNDIGQMASGGGLGFPFYEAPWLELSLMEPELVERWLTRAANRAVAQIRHMAAFGLRWISGGGDMAGETGPMLSPKTFRDILKAPLKLIADACSELAVVYCYRSDGNLWPIFDDLFGATGIQAYGEADRGATMAVGAIRARNPKLIVLGNTSSALLACGTESEVREDTCRQLEEAGGERFIPGPSNAVIHGTPVRNVFAMLEELHQ
jgi:uroporphyrinogen-III decarboxylase